MKRYIEIIFDNSGSMNSFINNKPKHIIAKSIFKDTIIPKLDLKNDYVVLRTLSSGCNNGLSEAKRLDNDKLEIINTIDSISCYGSTPLYYTIKDSIVACEKSGTHECHIFILTDGDDTCYVNPESILGDNFLKIKAQLNLNTILVQFAIESDISKNNLTSLSQKIGAKNVILSSNEIVDFDIIDKKISKVFIQTGLDKKGKFPHCKSEDLNEFYQLEQCSEYDYYLVELLYEEKLLKWKPSLKKWIDSNQKMELDFLYTLRFQNCISESQVKQMLSQLQKPYYYSFECIYWDFKERVWKHFPDIPELNLIPNPEAKFDDNIKEVNIQNKKYEKENFNSYQNYTVKSTNNIRGDFNLEEYNGDGVNIIILRDGNIIRFEN
jgi:hypothetical protein